MNGEVRWSRDCAIVSRVIALQSAHKLLAQMGGEERVFAIGLLASSPARIAEDVDVWRPDGQAEVDAVNAVADGLVILRARLGRYDVADVLQERRVPGRSHADGLRKQRGVSRASDAVQALVPIVVSRNPQA